MADGENGVSGVAIGGSAFSGVAKLTRNAELPGFLPRRTENARNARRMYRMVSYSPSRRPRSVEMRPVGSPVCFPI